MNLYCYYQINLLYLKLLCKFQLSPVGDARGARFSSRLLCILEAKKSPFLRVLSSKMSALSLGTSTKSCAHSVRSYWRSFEAKLVNLR